ncbi:MAG: hypothetical protein E8D51_05755 [Nitrospira sp.]|nr:MAG: hypothetical protein E8D51_05755 [Nitrospira sp.]
MTHLPGTLYIVGTPIGHPDDITIRALATLGRVSIIASEDPRATQALLIHHGITATITSYGPLNRQEKVPLLLHRPSIKRPPIMSSRRMIDRSINWLRRFSRWCEEARLLSLTRSPSKCLK